MACCKEEECVAERCRHVAFREGGCFREEDYIVMYEKEQH